MFLYTKVKGYFCSFLVSNIFLYTSLSLYRPTFFLRFYNPFFIHSFSPYYLVSKISLMLFWILSFFYEGRSCGSFYSFGINFKLSLNFSFLFLQFFVFFQKVQIFSFNIFWFFVLGLIFGSIFNFQLKAPSLLSLQVFTCTLVSPLCVYTITHKFRFCKTQFCTTFCANNCAVRRIVVILHISFPHCIDNTLNNLL